MSKIIEIIKLFTLWMGYVFYHNRKSKVLYYHDVSTAYTDMGTPLELIKKHINCIKQRGFSIVNIDKPENQIMIAFDDGWKGLYDHRDFFIKEKIYPTIFIAVDLIGRDGYMTKENIEEMYQLGFLFESHTWSHTGLPGHVGVDLKHETEGAKSLLERTFGHPFRAICYPQGLFSKDVIDACTSAGYNLMYSSISGNYDDYIEHHIICRNLVQYIPANQIKYIIEGNSAIIKRRNIKRHFTGVWPY